MSYAYPNNSSLYEIAYRRRAYWASEPNKPPSRRPKKSAGYWELRRRADKRARKAYEKDRG